MTKHACVLFLTFSFSHCNTFCSKTLQESLRLCTENQPAQVSNTLRSWADFSLTTLSPSFGSIDVILFPTIFECMVWLLTTIDCVTIAFWLVFCNCDNCCAAAYSVFVPLCGIFSAPTPGSAAPSPLLVAVLVLLVVKNILPVLLLLLLLVFGRCASRRASSKLPRL